jgi:hypothetical protein
LEVAADDIEADEGPAIAEVHVAINGRATDVHAHVAIVQGFEDLFLARIGVVELDFLHVDVCWL